MANDFKWFISALGIGIRAGRLVELQAPGMTGVKFEKGLDRDSKKLIQGEWFLLFIGSKKIRWKLVDNKEAWKEALAETFAVHFKYDMPLKIKIF